MKKKRLAGFLLLAPFCLLTACGGGGPATLPLEPNWFADASRTVIDNTYEKLEYSVKFQGSKPGDYSVAYDEGTYTTELKAETYEFDDHSSKTVYSYSTELQISGHFTYQGVVGETFNDFIRSEVIFHETGLNKFCPIRSTKTIHSTNPVVNPTEEVTSELFYVTRTVEYSTMKSSKLEEAPLTGATVTATVHATKEGEEDKTSDPLEVKIERDDSYLDNEQILFALRGLNMASASSIRFGTNNPQTDEIVTVKFTGSPSEDPLDLVFTIDGDPRPEGSIKAYKVQFGYDLAYSGMPRTAWYAAKTEGNPYRNVLLRLDDELPNGYGTLRYTLVAAAFTK